MYIACGVALWPGLIAPLGRCDSDGYEHKYDYNRLSRDNNLNFWNAIILTPQLQQAFLLRRLQIEFDFSPF